jgi:hypothetical protein
MTIVDARNVWSRAMAQIEARTLTEDGLAAARNRLERIREHLALPERSRADLYLDLLEQAWADRPGTAPGPPSSSPGPEPGAVSDRLLAAHRALAAGFGEEGDAAVRRGRAARAVEELRRLAAESDREAERLAIARMQEPLLRLLSSLGPGSGSGLAS